jgi:integrase
MVLNWSYSDSCSCYVTGELSTLRSDAKQSRLTAYAPGTRSNLRAQWKAYFTFCIFFGLQPVPSSIQVLCLFAQFLSRSFKSISAVKSYISGVRTLHLFLDVPLELAPQFILSLTLKGIAKQLRHFPLQKLPITPEILLRLHAVLDHDSQFHATLWCSFLFAFFLCARKSNLLPVSSAKFNPNQSLVRSDIQLSRLGLVVSIKWSKTNQTGEKFLTIPLLRCHNSVLCPVRAYERMLRFTSKASDSSPLFVFYNKKGKLAFLTFYSFDKELKRLLAVIGLQPILYSGHSFRRGGATWAFAQGFTSEALKLLGDWSSDAFLLYIHLSFQTRLDLAKKLSSSLANVR